MYNDLTQTFGTIAWGESSRGMLDSTEAARVSENLNLVITQEKSDAERRRLGLLNPKHIAVESLRPPDSAMAADALDFARATHPIPLLHHSWRTYFFGALIACHDGIEFDREEFFVAAILHDIGLTGHVALKPSECCFAVSGGIEIRDRLLARGCGRDKAQLIGDAISLHLNLHVGLGDHGAVACLTARGAVCDAFGPGLSRMSAESTMDVLNRHPRAGLSRFLAPGAFAHLAGTRATCIVANLLASGERPKNPLDSAPFT